MAWRPSRDEHEAGPVPGPTVPDPESIDPVWDEVLGTGYGRRFWNVGCG